VDAVLVDVENQADQAGQAKRGYLPLKPQ